LENLPNAQGCVQALVVAVNSDGQAICRWSMVQFVLPAHSHSARSADWHAAVPRSHTVMQSSRFVASPHVSQKPHVTRQSVSATAGPQTPVPHISPAWHGSPLVQQAAPLVPQTAEFEQPAPSARKDRTQPKNTTARIGHP
jgi:hypothetical protein